MADGADLVLDAAKLSADGDRMVRRYLTAGTTAVARATRGLEKELEAATRSAVPGKLWAAWQSEVYPRKGGPARNPAGEVFASPGARTQGAITFWTQPGSIRARDGKYLAIPLPAAGTVPGRRGRARPTPLEWETQHNIELEFVERPGRAALLVAQQGRLTRGGRVQRRSQRQAVADIGRESRISIPIFVLLPIVRFRNTVAIAPMVRASERELVREYLAAVGQIRGG